MPRRPHPKAALSLTVGDAPALPNGMATVFRVVDEDGFSHGLATPDERGYIRTLDHDRKPVKATSTVSLEVYDGPDA